MASRKDKAKSKKVLASKERFELPVNPDEPVHANWSKLSTYDFEQSRLEFNPYDFGQRTSSDNRFYCKMHEQVYEHVVCARKNTHVAQHFFDVEILRGSWPDVMELMDYHRSEERRVGKECLL